MNDGLTTESEPSPEIVPALAEKVRSEPRLHFIYSYSFVFESPNWPSNLLLTSISLVIPVIGPIVVAGYQYEIVEALHRRPKQLYPDFDFARFGDYLTRGVWAFLIGMITQMLLGMVYGALYIVSIVIVAVTASIAGQQNADAAIGIALMILVPSVLLILMTASLILRFITLPLILRASLSQDVGQLFNLRFLRDFIRRTWREMLLEQIWMAVTTPLCIGLGLLFFCVGMFPAIAWTFLADAQTNWQLYEIYLARGGEPIPLKSAPRPILATAAYYPPPNAE